MKKPKPTKAKADPIAAEEESTASAAAARFTPHMQRFCDEYLALGESNAAEAARRAGYSAKRAKAAAWEVLSRPDVQEYLKAKRGPVIRELAAKHKLTMERVLEENALIALSDIADVVELDKFRELTFIEFDKMDPGARRTIASLSTSPGMHGTKRSIKLWSKDLALSRIADLLAAAPPDAAEMTFSERARLLAQILEAGMKRAAAAGKAVP